MPADATDATNVSFRSTTPERATHRQDTVLFTVLAHLALRNRRRGRHRLLHTLLALRLTARALVWTPRCDWFGRAHIGVRVQASEPRIPPNRSSTRPFPWISPRPGPAPASTPSEPASLPSNMSQHRDRATPETERERSERAPALVRPHRLSRSRRNALRQCLAADPLPLPLPLSLPLGNEVHQQAPLPPQRQRQRLPNEGEETNRIQRTPPCLLISARSSIA